MPGMNGFDVCRKLRADPVTRDISVIFITARSDIDCEITALNAGAVDFISKPINPEIVRIRVNNYLTIKRLSDQLRQTSRIDGLTGIYNRKYFDEVLATEWARAIRSKANIGLLILDIDFFKSYNDHYGHPAGDTCLRVVAETVSSVVRDPPDFTARYGGEEFVCLLPNTELDGLKVVAMRILDSLHNRRLPHAFSNVSDHITVSIGGAHIMPQSDTVPDSLIHIADKRLYKAKENGRNRCEHGD